MKRIRHYDGTPDCAERIAAQSLRGSIKAVVWTWQKHRICPTLKEAEHALKVWKRWYERRGWTVMNVRVLGHASARAIEPGTNKMHACTIQEYNPNYPYLIKQ